MNAPVEYKWSFLMLSAFVLIPVFLFILALLARRFSIKSVFVSVTAILLLGVLLVVPAFITVRRAVPEHATVLTQTVSPSPPVTVIQRSELPLNLTGELRLVARKPGEEKELSTAESSQKNNVEALPEWVISGLEKTHQNQNNLLESSKHVYESGLFVTMDEAQYDALLKACQRINANLRLRYPEYPSAELEVSPDELRRLALRRDYYQLVMHDFGNVLKNGEPLKQNMYRAYLEIEDTPGIRETIFTKWKREQGNQRAVWLGGSFGLITLLCAGVALYLRAMHKPDTMDSRQPSAH